MRQEADKKHPRRSVDLQGHTVQRIPRFARHGARQDTVVVSHKTRHLSFFFAPFVTSHLRQNRTDERSFHVGWILPKIPHEKGDRARHGQRGTQILVDPPLSMDPHNRRGSASFSTFPEDQPSHEGGAGRGRERKRGTIVIFCRPTRRFYLLPIPAERYPMERVHSQIRITVTPGQFLASILFSESLQRRPSFFSARMKRYSTDTSLNA